MKLKLVGGDSAGVVTAYYVSLIRMIYFLMLFTKLQSRNVMLLIFIYADVHGKWGRPNQRRVGLRVLGKQNRPAVFDTNKHLPEWYW